MTIVLTWQFTPTYSRTSSPGAAACLAARAEETADDEGDVLPMPYLPSSRHDVPPCATPFPPEAATPHAPLSPPRTSWETPRTTWPKACQRAGNVRASGRGQPSVMLLPKAMQNILPPKMKPRSAGPIRELGPACSVTAMAGGAGDYRLQHGRAQGAIHTQPSLGLPWASACRPESTMATADLWKKGHGFAGPLKGRTRSEVWAPGLPLRDHQHVRSEPLPRHLQRRPRCSSLWQPK
jgi:hypothetical protein